MTKKIIIGVLFVVALALSSFWSFKVGLSINNSFEAIKYIVMVQQQQECIEKSDWLCVSKANKIMASVTAAQLRRTDTFGLGQSDRQGVEQFLSWEKELNREKQGNQP